MLRLGLISWLLVVALAQIDNSVDLTNSDCALLLDSNIPAAFPYSSAKTCITFDAINQAYLDARQRIQVSIPADGQWTHPQIASVGELLLDISTQLAKSYGMTVEDIEKGLGEIDTMKTMIREVCPAYLSDVTCQPGKYRRHDGLCNNLNNPSWGATNAPFQRLLIPQFSDAMSNPRESVLGTPLPLPRVVSRTIHPDDGFHDHAGTVMVVAWGQFMDHDFTLTGTPLDRFTKNEPEECCNRPPHLKHPYCMEIVIPEDDYFYSKHNVKCQDFVRSFPAVRPNCRLGSRVPFNTLTGVIDGNTVYGVTEDFARHLRSGYGGLLRMNPAFEAYGLKDLLPLKVDIPDEGCTRANNTEYCFEAGEIRVNEQLVLACMHTLMAREHNRVAKELAQINPHWDDETLYQEARRIIIAQIQHITFNEFLPIILGKEVMQKFGLMLEKEGYWDGYDPSINPNIIDAFAAAAFRFGHSLLPTAVERWSKAHKFIASKRLSDLIRRPYDLYRAGVLDEYLMGLMNQVAQAMDDSITQEVTNHLLKKPGHHFGMDLVAFNMQRGREFGVPGFMFFRKFCGLPGGEDFEELFGSMPNTTVHRYMQIFQHPMDVDLWSGGVSEKPLPGSMIGPTFACIIATQMSYIRRGDRFWYELPNQPSSFTPEQLQEIRKTKLSRIICDNTDLIDTIQVYPMVLPDYEINPRVACRSGVLPSIDLTKWADYGNEIMDPVTRKMNQSQLTQALHKDKPLYANAKKSFKADDNKNGTSNETNKTIVATSKPLEVVLKNTNSSKPKQNFTNLKVLGMRSGSEINSVSKKEKVSGKGASGRRKRGTYNRGYRGGYESYDDSSSREAPVPVRNKGATYKAVKSGHHNVPIFERTTRKPKRDMTTTKPKSKKSKKKTTPRPLTESEEEALYDEEGEISEKEIENAYKNYDDSQITQAFVDYEIDPEETQLKEIKVPINRQNINMEQLFKNVTHSFTGKGRKSRQRRATNNGTHKRSFGTFEYPSSKEILNFRSSEITPRSSEDPTSFIDLHSFEDFIKPIPPPFTNKKRDPARSFMTTKFFSSEDFINSPLSDSQFFSDENGESRDGELFSGERIGSNSSQKENDEDEYVDEKDAYDIHGFRSVNIQDRSAGPKPPAYTLAQKSHDFTPSRLHSGKPVVFPLRKAPTVSSFRTNIIHKFPGFAIPGSSSEVPNSTLKKDPLYSVNMHHGHMNDIKMNHLQDIKPINNIKGNNVNGIKLNNLNGFKVNNINSINVNNLNGITGNNLNGLKVNNFNGVAGNHFNGLKVSNLNGFTGNNVNAIHPNNIHGTTGNNLNGNLVHNHNPNTMNNINSINMNNLHNTKLSNINMEDIKLNHEKLNNMINNIEVQNAKPNIVIHHENNNNESSNNSEGNNSESNDNGEDDDDDSGEEHHHHHYYDQLRHVHINPPKGFDPDSFRLTLPHYIKRGKYTGKKHKHFHHIENAPVIIKYDNGVTPNPNDENTTKKPKSSKKKPTNGQLTESEEEAMYDEEHEISEKEIENAYKNYDDSQITKDFVHDYEVESESRPESKVKAPINSATALSKYDSNSADVDRIFENVSRALNLDTNSKVSEPFSNFWKV